MVWQSRLTRRYCLDMAVYCNVLKGVSWILCVNSCNVYSGTMLNVYLLFAARFLEVAALYHAQMAGVDVLHVDGAVRCSSYTAGSKTTRMFHVPSLSCGAQTSPPPSQHRNIAYWPFSTTIVCIFLSYQFYQDLDLCPTPPG
jgi:hypothetical protein